MIERVTSLVNDLHSAMGLGSRFTEQLTELLWSNLCRTTGSYQQTARRDTTQSQCIDSHVGAHGSVLTATCAGKARRIKNDNIEHLSSPSILVKQRETIVGHKAMTVCWQMVESDISGCRLGQPMPNIATHDFGCITA
jgi:hypothetical protein